MIDMILKTVHWLLVWIYYVCIICFIGAVLGVVTHVSFGLLFLEKADYGYLAAFGFMNGFKYSGVWAGGLSIVLCVMRARKEYLARHAREGEVR